MRYLIIIAILAIAVSGYAQENTIILVPDQDVELEENIVKYDLTTYKKVKDIKDVEFTVIDKTERLDIHQIEYDIEQAQNEIDRMTLKIPELQAEILERNKLIAEIKKIKE